MALSDHVRGILSTKNLTLYKISALTRARYPRMPSYHIPRNFYFQLRSGLSPTLHQLCAFSQLSGYRLVDWLAVFGFHVHEIPRLQAALDQPRTTLLDNTLYDARASIPWFRERSSGELIPPIAPLSQLLERSGARHLSSLVSVDPDSYLYAKIGRQDVYAFPDLVPGSIVRANTRLVERVARESTEDISKHIFLVEHGRGLCCCRLHFNAKNRITLTSNELPFANVELELGSEARILGVLDMELRPLPSQRRSATQRYAPAEVAPDLARLWAPVPLNQGVGRQQPAVLIRSARRRAGLSLRQASELSRAVAAALHDQRYFASPGSLSEYEARDTPPRHIHKLFTICILYSIRFRELLLSFGLAPNETHMATIPDEWMVRSDGFTAENQSPGKTPVGGFLALILKRFGDVPLFLHQSLRFLSGLRDISMRDVFWVGGRERAMHPSFGGALFVIVNRRKRKPRIFRRKSAQEQPLYLLMKREGSYVMASCGIENGMIVVHPYTEGFVRPERLRNGVDAEVVGQIVTVIRSLPPPP